MSEIPTLRGWGDELQGLPQLGQALSGLVGGGDYNMQQEIRKAIAKDPTIADSLGQLSRDNPSLFGALKLGKLGDKLAQQPQGFQQKHEAAQLEQASATLAGTKANTQGQLNENDLADVRKSIAHYQLADLKDKNAQLEEQAHGYPGLKRGLGQVADDIINGKNPPELSYIAGQQGLAPLLQNITTNKQQMRGQDASMERYYARQDRETQKKTIDEGTAFFKKYGVGTPQVWAEYLSNPLAQQTAEDLVKNPGKAGNDPHLKALLAIGSRLQQDDDLHTHAQTTQNTLAADKVLRDVSAGKVDRNTGLQQVNQFLDQNAQLMGTRKIMIVPGDQVPGKNSLQKWMARNKNIAVDAVTHEDLGNINDISDTEKYATQPASQQYTQQDLEQAKAGLSSATPKDLSDLQKQHPQMYQALLPYIQMIEQQKKAKKQ